MSAPIPASDPIVPVRDHWLSYGLLAGVIGYVTAALVFVLGDLATGHNAFRTAALLGSAYFYGLRDPSPLVIWPGPVFAYNGLHLVIFLGLGLIAAWLAELSERAEHFWFVSLFFFLFIAAHLFAMVQLATEEIRSSIPMWLIGGASVASGVAVLAYLLSVHPAVRHQLVAPIDDQEVYPPA